MTVECDRDNYMSITLSKFTYKWGDLFATNTNEGINHFQIQLRKFENRYAEFKFSQQKFYPIYEDKKEEVKEVKDEEETKDQPTGYIYIIGVRKKRVYKYSFSDLRVRILHSGKCQPWSEIDQITNNIFKSFNGFLQVKEIDELEIKNLIPLKYDPKLEKDLLDFWNYDPHIIEDFFFIDCQNNTEDFLRNYQSENLYKEIKIRKAKLEVTLTNIFGKEFLE